MICNVCKKEFKTKQGLADHNRVVHKPAPKSKRSRPRRRGAPAGESVRVNGRDRIFSHDYPVASTPTTNSVVVEVVIGAHIGSRMAVMARAFERVRFNRLRFSISNKTSSIVAGGYVAGFLPGSSSHMPTVDSISASTGSTSRPWHSTGIVDVPAQALVRALSTTIVDDPMEWSPGSFFLIVDGKADQPLTIVVELEWDVTFSVPAFDKQEQPMMRYTLKDNFKPLQGSNCSDKSAKELLEPTPPSGRIAFRTSFPIVVEYSEGIGNTGTNVYWYLHCDDGGPLYWGEDHNTAGSKWQSNVTPHVLIPKGVELEVFHPPPTLSRRRREAHSSDSRQISSESSSIASTDGRLQSLELQVAQLTTLLESALKKQPSVD